MEIFVKLKPEVEEQCEHSLINLKSLTKNIRRFKRGPFFLNIFEIFSKVIFFNGAFCALFYFGTIKFIKHWVVFHLTKLLPFEISLNIYINISNISYDISKLLILHFFYLVWFIILI